jgi:hypothetical protein
MISKKQLFSPDKSSSSIVLTLITSVVMLISTPSYSASTDASISMRSDDGLWTQKLKTFSAVSAETEADAVQHVSVPRSQIFTLDKALMDTQLAKSPMEFSVQVMASPLVMMLPLPQGGYTQVRVEESPLLSPALQSQYPGIKTYRVTGIDDPSATGRFDVTPAGFHGQLISSQGTLYVDPAGDDTYQSYWKHDVVSSEPFQCETTSEQQSSALGDLTFPSLSMVNNPSGNQLRTYRMAISTPGEYTNFFGGTAGAAAQITTTLNRVTGIFERGMSISFNLVATNIYDDPDTDPFPDNPSASTLANKNQEVLDDIVGSDNYDIGHIFNQGGGGGVSLGLGIVCTDGSKAKGATSLPNPSGDVFDVDYVSHEIGHQLGGSHTWNSNTGSCSAGQFAASAAYEPGSGSTIMGYAGICSGQNVQPNSDDYFHSRSFDEITAYRDGGGACGTVTATGNNAPIADAGADYTIPQDTPFKLTATGSDPDVDTLTYNWEQYDLGTRDGLPQSTFTAGPVFRSVTHTTDATRTLPTFPDVLAAAPGSPSTTWEMLSTVDRSLNFRVTARDNRANGGGVDWDAMQITVAGAPFRVTSPSGGENLECGGDEAIFWSVGGGSVASNVRVLLSEDNGSNFSTLVASTANDGSATVSVPTDTVAADVYLMLEPTDNIFFAVSGQVSLVDGLDPVVTPPADLIGVECTAPDGASPDIGTAVSTDQCDSALIESNDAPSVFPLGSTAVNWSAVDDSGNSTTAVQTINVIDTTVPDISAPGHIVAECTSPDGTAIDLGEAVVADICDVSPAISDDALALYPLGETVVTWSATDLSGNVGTDTQTVTVTDTIPPQIEVVLSTEVIWPPNHKLVTVKASITVVDVCDADLQVRLVSITSNEPDNGLGDGDKANDIQLGTDDLVFSLRAERSGLGDGRTYTVTYEVEDDSGNVAIETATVSVPHNEP